MPFLVPRRPWESISMDVFGGLTMNLRGHESLFDIVYHFIKMCFLIPCKMEISG
jgi:hypothetical protein